MQTRTSALLTAALIVGAAPSLAQSIPVQTGEHASFTRLAMRFSNPVTWTEATTETGYSITFDSSNLALDLSNSFRLIPRDRVADLRWNAEAGRLEIDSDCDCHLHAFELPDNILVLDIKTGPDPDGSGNEQAAPEIAETEPVSPPLPPVGPALPLLLSNQQTLTARFEAAPEPVELNGLSEEQLLRSISAAASEGLLSLAAPEEEGAILQGDAAGLLDHIGSRSATALRSALQDDSDSQASLNCPDASDVTIADWGDGTPQHMIASGRNHLFDGRGQLDRDGVLEHAKALLHLGFGAEARMHLKLIGTRSRQIDTLREISFVVDGEHDRAFPVLQSFMGCVPDAALWAVISGGEKGSAVTLDAEGLYGTFLSLPTHLQRLLSADLVRNLRRIGEDDIAASLLAAIDRLPGKPTSELRMLKGMDDIAGGDIDTGEIALGEVIFESSDSSPTALLHLMEARETRGSTVPEDILILAESLAVELGDDPLAQALTRASARAHAADGRFETAFALMEDLEADSGKKDVALRNALAVKLAQGAPDNVFLILAFKHDLTDPETTGQVDAAKALAERLLSLGFTEEARRLAAMLPDADRDTTRLNAEIAIARGQPQDAVSLLSDATDAQLQSLRAEALRAVNAQPEAAELFDALGANADARATAWESGTDDLIAEFGSAEEQTLIESINGGGTALPLGDRAIMARTDVSFTNLEELLSGTAGFREAARDLLEDQQVGNQ